MNNEYKLRFFIMSEAKTEINDAPGLEDIGNLIHPSSSASSSPIANVSMKLSAYWPDAAEVWFPQADAPFVI